MRAIKKLSIVFSFRNEEQVLPELVQRVVAAVGTIGCDYEVIFVNDDSTDGSLELLLSLAEKNDRIKIITMSRRFGVHPCVMAGLSFTSGDAVVYMDSDLQDPPELIPAMVEKYKDGADVVNMTRTDRRGEHAAKMWITSLAYKIINSMSDISIPENTGDFKLLSRRVVENILSLRETDPFMRGLVYWVGFRQDTIHYVREARFAGDTHFSLLSGGPIKEFFRGITSFSVIPLYLSLLIGLVATLIAFITLTVILVLKALGLNLPGWTSIMAATLFLGGTTHICLGIIGVYVGKIYSESKRRPMYIVKEVVGRFGDNVK
jgi:dolichol-phosphate mannosyltransferase